MREVDHLTNKREQEGKIMARKKVLPTCKSCGSNDALYVTLRNGERLPSYVMKVADGIYCNDCAGK